MPLADGLIAAGRHSAAHALYPLTHFTRATARPIAGGSCGAMPFDHHT